MFAAFAQGSLIRLIPVGMVMLALQRTVFVDIKVAGVTVQVVLALAAAAGASGGSERGAVAGFVLGAMFDLVEGTPLGSTAIAFTIAGAVAGLLAVITAEPQWWLKALFVGLGCAAGEALLPVVRVFIGEESPWPANMLKVILVVGLAGALMSPVLVPLSRWCLKIRGPAWTAPVEQQPI
ncbi:MAG: rod shape-determining protein MreD [Ilumatobacter sp.]|nr:rod shape-determining protein MreD [bacterium]MDG1265585.1 rod shape-determining protein MreD [Ilumatobacter sp.]MDG2039536.1 rod shape-determining protein MreD [Ilumatobacter sp.]NKB39674.1 rod shape-determining protein MreD [Ilumatobacter sp.]